VSALLGSLHLLLAVQAAPADLSGMVRDEETGAPIAGAVVALPDLDRTTLADAGGRYLLPGVPAGPQHVAVRFLGYSPRTIHVLVPASGRLEVGLALRAAPLRLRTIEVSPPLAIQGFDIERTAGYPDRAMSMAAVRNDPLLAEPDALRALGGGEVVLDPESPSGIHVRGAPSDQVGFLLDGLPVLSPYHSAGTFGGWNPDALAGIRLAAAAPSFEGPDALAGVISAETRRPGSRHGAQGGLTTTQARLTLDGPLGPGEAGYLFSIRTGFPGYPAPDGDPSYLRSESGDRLAKLEAPAFGGRLLLLGYDNDNEISAATGRDPGEGLTRHELEWAGRTVGASWRRSLGALELRAAGWSAGADAAAAWQASAGRLAMAARRRDLGLMVELIRTDGDRRTTGGVRIERSATSYAGQGDGDIPTWNLASRTPSFSLFAAHQRPLARRATLDFGLAAGAAAEGAYLLPRGSLAWSPTERWTVSAAYARMRQAEQSLRNPESVVGNVFPADLFVGSGVPGVPEARAQQAVVAAEFRPSGGLRVAVQLYDRVTRGLLLAAPRTGDPFAAGRFSVGTGAARGLVLSAAARGSRFGVVASYALQDVELRHGDSTFVPSHGASHLIEAGVIVFPTATLSLRLGASGAGGRRTTATLGTLEWEACNLLDRGCELSGSPGSDTASLGGRRLPAYVRLDLGVRQHWHLRIGGRDASVALFGTLTNLLGRENVLTYVIDPETGEAAAVGMRPRAPLVVGLDWRL
jgi:hypothetical protein